MTYSRYVFVLCIFAFPWIMDLVVGGVFLLHLQPVKGSGKDRVARRPRGYIICAVWACSIIHYSWYSLRIPSMYDLPCHADDCQMMYGPANDRSCPVVCFDAILGVNVYCWYESWYVEYCDARPFAAL